METIKNILSLLLASIYIFGSVHGVDVSHRQGEIDWHQVAADKQNIKFAYIKATEGATFVDDRFKENVSGAYSAGLDVGAYHFFRMTSSPKKQFENFKKQISSCKSHLTLIPVVDVETFDGKTSSEVKKAVEEFVDLCYREYHVYPIIYGPDIAPKRMLSDKVNKNCLFFLGQPGVMEPKQKHAIWQYACRGRVSGIKPNVDLNRLHRKTKLEDLRL